ncbi:MAG: aldo/keto reductase [Lachnospiraceae bacterium]|nr:aldo/keto reductase [Lachnospiraceae bacterium]
MEYRRMENIDAKVSLLGFGCMRFPTDANGKIEETEALKMIDMAYQAGVNYYDTAYPYHGGASEGFVGKALARYPRESYYLATKLPIWEVKTIEDCQRIFDLQLERLQKEYVDFYLLHALNKERWETIKNLDILKWCEKLRSEGKIRYIGFSFHDDYDVFKEIVTGYSWDFCQIQLNYMDKDTQATTKGVELAESLGIPMVIMEPIKGGSLANLPEDITQMFREADDKASTSSWALRYVGSFHNVKVILSGMSALEHVEDNLKTFTNFKVLSDTEQQVVENVANTLHSRVQNGCTACKYCMPCPAGVNIPGSFGVWNEYHVYQNVNDTKWSWTREIPEEAKPKNCIKCGKCEKVCPQKISIRKDLERVQAEMDALMGE